EKPRDRSRGFVAARGWKGLLRRVARLERFADEILLAGAAAALGDAGRLAAAFAQVIELGAADLAPAHHFDAVDGRREQREHALHAFAEADLADGEVGVHARARAGDDRALMGLAAFAVAVLDLAVAADGVARIEGRDGLALGDAGGFFLLERLDQVHRRYRSAR